MSNFEYGNCNSEEIETFTYSGVVVNRKKNEQQDIKDRIQKGCTALYCVKEMLEHIQNARYWKYIKDKGSKQRRSLTQNKRSAGIDDDDQRAQTEISRTCDEK